MTRFTCALIIAVHVAHFGAVRHCAANSDSEAALWKERLLKEGPPAWQAWQQFNRHLEGVVRVTEFGTATAADLKYPLKPRETIEWIFRFNGDWALQEARVIETSDRGTQENPRPSRGAVAISSKYGFSVKRQSEDSSWVIRNVVTRNQEKLRGEFDEGVVVYLEAPWVFYYGYFPLPTLIHERGFKLKNCETVLRDGREHCKVTFDYTPTQDKLEWTASMKDAWVVLDPERQWSIREWQIPEYVLNGQRSLNLRTKTTSSQKLSMSVSGTNRYGELSQGFPLLRETQQRAAAADGYVDTNVVFEKLAYRESIPEAEFGLAQYGLPEPFGPLASGRSARGPILILAGMLAIVVAGLLYYRVRNARAAQS